MFILNRLIFQKTLNIGQNSDPDCEKRKRRSSDIQTAAQAEAVCPSLGGDFHCANSSFKMLFTLWGLALPFSSRMTWPTRKPKALSLPPL